MLLLQALVLEDLVKNGTLEKTLSHKKVGYYIGSFDPLHKGHERVAQSVIEHKLCDYVIIYPAWGGDEHKNRIDVHLRLDMLFSVFAKHPRVIVTRYNPKELQQALTTPVADSKFRAPKFAGLEFIGVIGSDTALSWAKSKHSSFMKGVEMKDEWANQTIGGVIALPVHSFIVSQRAGDDLTPLHNKIKDRGIIAVISSSTAKGYSSTMVRKLLSLGKDISKFVSPGVQKIIDKCKLYQK